MTILGATRSIVSEEYDKLMPDEGVVYDSSVHSDLRCLRRWKIVGALSFGLNLIAFVSIIALASSSRKGKAVLEPQFFYSPANEAIEYVPKLFHPAIANRNPTEYQGEPSPELDQKWDDLYSFGMSSISKHEADKLPNKTDPMLVGESSKPQYLIQLDVFHQIHCIDMLRRSIWPDYYKHMSSEYMDKDHLSHCVDSIRQAIQCYSDVTPLVWRWHEESQKMMGHLNMPHTCRNFEKIQEWARPMQIVGRMNLTYHVHDYE